MTVNVESAAAAFAVTNNLPFSQNLPRDHKSLNFAGAFADGAELHVAIELLDGVVLNEAVTSMDLHRLIGIAHGRL